MDDDETVPLRRYETLDLSRQGRRLTITMNRPDSLNAVDRTMHHELADVFPWAAADAQSDVIVLTGAGRAFSAGGELGDMEDSIAHPERFDEGLAVAKRIVMSLLDIEKPVVARINGHAVGLGATLALLCDVSFAAEDARIGDPHVRVGLVAGDGGAAFWPHLVGFARAKEYLLTGELLTGAKAAEIGLVNHAVPASDLDAACDAFCDRLLAGATRAVRWTKAVMNIELKRLAAQAMDAGLAYEALSVRTADHREGVAAIRERREPRFRGE